ncbi:MAG TPA: hypothetical protein VFV84_15950 [Burkholderiales bacterium]|nr:hypothetical protein [Burkholderiales bacterium]
MKAQPEGRWNLVKAGVLAGLGLALAGLAFAMANPEQSPQDLGRVAAIQADDEVPFVDDPRGAAAGGSASRDPSLAGLRVSPDAPDEAPVETF